MNRGDGQAIRSRQSRHLSAKRTGDPPVGSSAFSPLDECARRAVARGGLPLLAAAALALAAAAPLHAALAALPVWELLRSPPGRRPPCGVGGGRWSCNLMTTYEPMMGSGCPHHLQSVTASISEPSFAMGQAFKTPSDGATGPSPDSCPREPPRLRVRRPSPPSVPWPRPLAPSIALTTAPLLSFAAHLAALCRAWRSLPEVGPKPLDDLLARCVPPPLGRHGAVGMCVFVCVGLCPPPRSRHPCPRFVPPSQDYAERRLRPDSVFYTGAFP